MEFQSLRVATAMGQRGGQLRHGGERVAVILAEHLLSVLQRAFQLFDRLQVQSECVVALAERQLDRCGGGRLIGERAFDACGDVIEDRPG